MGRAAQCSGPGSYGVERVHLGVLELAAPVVGQRHRASVICAHPMVEEVHEATPEILAGLNRLLPQLSAATNPVDEPALTRVLESDTTRLLVARDRDGQIVGTLTLAVFRIPTGLRAWIEDVVVDSAARGQGVGEALTRAALAIAAEEGATTVDLTSRASREAANRMYRRIGFAERETNLYRYNLSVEAERGE
jgi:ribosomal protein S18 acetylase RimI-like enzyme